MDTRKRLGNHDKEVKSQFDKNQKLTGTLRQNTRSVILNSACSKNLIIYTILINDAKVKVNIGLISLQVK